MIMMLPGFNLGSKLFSNQVSNTWRLQQPSYVSGAKTFPSFNAAIQLTLATLLPDLSA